MAIWENDSYWGNVIGWLGSQSGHEFSVGRVSKVVFLLGHSAARSRLRAGEELD